MARAYSINEILNKKYKLLDFRGAWFDAFGKPEARGVWFVYGNSSNGKGSFLYQLSMELSRNGRVAINEMEEGSAKTVQDTLSRHRMEDYAGKILIIDNEPMEELAKRLRRHKSPEFIIINSFQYTQLNYRQYIEFKEEFRSNKLIIFSSHADGKQPAGRAAKSVMYDADMKIWVEGYRAISKGRYIGEKGYFDVWPEKALRYWGERVPENY